MRKLIEKEQGSFVECDNPKCDYTVPYDITKENYLVLYVGLPCPKCGENLLTEEDYLQYKKIIKVVDFINRWFSWITLFYPKKELKKNSVHVHVYNGIKIKPAD